METSNRVEQTYELLQTIAEDLADELSLPNRNVKVVISMSVSTTRQDLSAF